MRIILVPHLPDRAKIADIDHYDFAVIVDYRYAVDNFRLQGQ